MECTCIRYSRVPKAAPLLVDYLYHFEKVASFYNGMPFDVASYRAIAGAVRSTPETRGELAETLARQNSNFGSSEATFRNIDRLTDPATFAVVTGQQVALASGPAFTLYKALTAVRLSQWLSEQGISVVPVFWLATEDHDLEEVSKTAIFDEEYGLVELRDSGDRPFPRSSVGYVKLTKEITAVLAQLEAALPPSESRDRLLGDLRETCQPGIGWGTAFGRFMARLFGRWGVVLMDPLDEDIHNLCAPVYQQALAQAGELRGRLQERSRSLVQAGYHAQVHVADGSTLLFAARNGNRLPIDELGHLGQVGGHAGRAEQPGNPEQGRSDGGFSTGGNERLSLRELETWVHDRPIDFTPTALLRPIVQDRLLPTIAYVAGPSELAYLGQAQSLYPLFGRPMPVVFPRAAFTLVDRKVRRLMDKYRITVEDTWKGEAHLNPKIAAIGMGEGGAEGWAERFGRTQQEFSRSLERLRLEVERLDPTLLDTLKHAEEKIHYQVERLKGKVSRAALDRSALLTRHQQTLLNALAPQKSLQEREVGGISFLGRAGYDLLDRLLARIQTACSDHQVVDT